MPYESVEERMDRLEAVVETFAGDVKQDIAEMRQWRVQSQKQWGEIAQKMGTFLEDIVAPIEEFINMWTYGIDSAMLWGYE